MSEREEKLRVRLENCSAEVKRLREFKEAVLAWWTGAEVDELVHPLLGTTNGLAPATRRMKAAIAAALEAREAEYKRQNP